MISNEGEVDICDLGRPVLGWKFPILTACISFGFANSQNMIKSVSIPYQLVGIDMTGAALSASGLSVNEFKNNKNENIALE